MEVYRGVDRWKAEYRSVTRVVDRNPLVIDDFPGMTFRAADFLPASPRSEAASGLED